MTCIWDYGWDDFFVYNFANSVLILWPATAGHSTHVKLLLCFNHTTWVDWGENHWTWKERHFSSLYLRNVYVGQRMTCHQIRFTCLGSDFYHFKFQPNLEVPSPSSFQASHVLMCASLVCEHGCLSSSAWDNSSCTDKDTYHSSPQATCCS